MMIHVPDLLTQDELKLCRERLTQGQWVDGRGTAGRRGAKVKDNLQLAPDGAEAVELANLVAAALQRHPLVVAAAMPHSFSRPGFSRYEPGMTYGLHADAAIHPIPRVRGTIRADIAATLFLSPPEEYDGGELTVEDTYGPRSVKLPAGHLVLYPANSLHRVTPVTRGVRLVSFFWIQSMIRNDDERRMLFELDQALSRLNLDIPDHPSLVRLSAIYHNCLRKWGEL